MQQLLKLLSLLLLTLNIPHNSYAGVESAILPKSDLLITVNLKNTVNQPLAINLPSWKKSLINKVMQVIINKTNYKKDIFTKALLSVNLNSLQFDKKKKIIKKSLKAVLALELKQKMSKKKLLQLIKLVANNKKGTTFKILKKETHEYVKYIRRRNKGEIFLALNKDKNIIVMAYQEKILLQVLQQNKPVKITKEMTNIFAKSPIKSQIKIFCLFPKEFIIRLKKMVAKAEKEPVTSNNNLLFCGLVKPLVNIKKLAVGITIAEKLQYNCFMNLGTKNKAKETEKMVRVVLPMILGIFYPLNESNEIEIMQTNTNLNIKLKQNKNCFKQTP